MKKIIKLLFFLILFLVAVVGGYWAYLKYFNQQKNVDAFNLVPQETLFVLRTNDISEAWTHLSNTSLWQKLIQTEYFKEWDEDLRYIDQFLDSNKIAKYLFADRSIIMAAVVGKKDWDFLYIVDLSQVSKALNDFKSLLKFIDGYTVKFKNVKINEKNYEIIELIDNAAPQDVLYIALVNNVLLATYTKDILIRAILEKDDDHWKNDKNFEEIINLNPGEKLFKIFVNYKNLKRFFDFYFTEEDESIKLISEALKYSNLDLFVENDRIVLNGITTADSNSIYIQTLLSVKPAKAESYRIMTNQTAGFISISFDDYSEFYNKLMELYKTESPEDAETMEKSLNFLKNTLNIDINRDFIDWIGNEVAIYKIRPLTNLSRAEDIAIVINAKDIEQAKTGLDNITKKIKQLSPFKFKELQYKNFTINYFKQKGFFKIFFGKLFDKIEKPYYTFIEDYVIFTNSLELIEQIIDDYIAHRTLDNNENFNDFIEDFGVKNTLSIFVQMPKMYPTIYYFTPAKDRKDLEENKDLIMSFSYFGFRLVTFDKGFKTIIMTQYDPEAPISDKVELLSLTTENQSIIEFIDTAGYILEIPFALKEDGEFQEFYEPEKTLKIEGEISDNKMQGTWKIYYKSGNLKAVAHYQDDALNGTYFLYYDNAQNTVRAEINFVDNQVNGVVKEYYPNGAQKAILFYKDGKLDGTAEFFYETGSLKIKGNYKKGLKNGKWIYYDKEGNIIKKEKWKNGELKKSVEK